MRIIHVVNIHGEEARHQAARASWEPFYSQGMVPCHIERLFRDARTIGDERPLPFLRDLLLAGLLRAQRRHDIILWSNDDVAFLPGMATWAERVETTSAQSMRRDEPNHIGREVFCFTAHWLRTHWTKIPDYILGAPCFDLALAAQIRKHHGIKSTMANLHEDIPPAETSDRFAHHSPHPSSWAGAKENTHPANRHNKRLANQWFKANQIDIHL